MISVIIPLHKIHSEFEAVRRKLQKADYSFEVIIIAKENSPYQLKELRENEKFIKISKKGRGHAVAAGLREAKGSTILVLHGDTVLPDQWDLLILNSLSNDRVSGGGFSLSFDRSNPLLRSLIFLSDLFYFATGELWGDRGMFFRAKVTDGHISKVDIPLMEDVVLSKLIREQGQIIKVKEKVITSSGTFYKKGLLRHTVKILICRGWFMIGGNPRRIYKFYYS